MSLIKNRSTLYAIMRRDNNNATDVVCAFTKTLENAERLVDEYEQQWIDSGGDSAIYYYPVGNIFYDE